MTNKIIISENNNPHYNLALEEYLIDQQDPCLYLWINGPTIVIGKNQNAYGECDIERLEEDNVYLARRKSGGGAVYHDLGNLCFTIISEYKDNNIEENFGFVTDALSNLGIDAKFSGRNDILVDDKKISGNAFYRKGDIFCHHGTLMVDLDTSVIDSYLTPSKLKLESKAIKSTKSRVVNLVDIDPNINMDSVIQALADEYKSIYPDSEEINMNKDDIEANPEIAKKYQEYSAKEWVYDSNPSWNLSIEERFDWGIVDIKLLVKNNIIQDAKVYTDSIIVDDFDGLSENLQGLELKTDLMVEQVRSSIDDDQVKEDIVSVIPKLFK